MSSGLLFRSFDTDVNNGQILFRRFAEKSVPYKNNEGGVEKATEHPWQVGESFDIFGYVPMPNNPDIAAPVGGSVVKQTNGRITVNTGKITNVGMTSASSYTINVYASVDNNINSDNVKYLSQN